MPFDGSGTFIPLPTPTYPAVSGQTIMASRFNAVIDDVLNNGLSQVLPRDGQGAMVGPLNFGGFRGINLLNPVSPQDAMTKAYADGSSGYRAKSYLADIRDFGVVARGMTSNEYTSEINAAFAQLHSEGVTAVMTCEDYRVAGTLTQPSSLAIVSPGGVSRWYEGSPANELPGPGFYKPSDGLDGALLIRGVGAHLIGITLDHQKVGGAASADECGIMQMGPSAAAATFNNTLTMNCHIRGHEINESTGLRRGSVDFSTEFGIAGEDCTAIFFPASDLGYQRYWHQFINPYIENCRTGFRFNNQSNGNFVSGYRFRGVYRPVWMKGGVNECIENIIDGAWAQNYPLPTTTQTAATISGLPYNDQNTAAADVALITAEDLCRLNQFRGPTEGGGRTWYLSATTQAASNDASGLINNEAFPAPQPAGWSLPVNEFDLGKRGWGEKQERYMPLGTAADNASQGGGSAWSYDKVLTTGLPLLNGAAGAPTTGAASRVITEWTTPLTVGKIARPHIRLRTRIVVSANGGGAGSHETEVEWAYRVADNATNAGELSVISVRQFPTSPTNYVVGMHFIKGITGGDRPFALSITTGNIGAVAPADVSVHHFGAIESTQATVRPMAEFADISTVPRALTANDVLDAVSMLTVAITAV